MQHACIILSSVACQALQYFSKLSDKQQEFQKQKLLNTKCVFWFSLQLSSETFLILRRIRPDMIKNAYWSSRNCPLLLSAFNQTWMFSPDFRKILKYKFSRKSIPAGAEMFHEEGQTDVKLTVVFIAILRTYPTAERDLLVTKWKARTNKSYMKSILKLWSNTQCSNPRFLHFFMEHLFTSNGTPAFRGI
jgi:hypothetical protein